MVVIKGNHHFELSVDESYGEWVAALREYVPGRLYPTVHMLRAFTSRESAIEALCRKWRVLFPEQGPLVWREPAVVRSHWRSERQPKGSRKERSEPGC
jgi:hypothetical protein